jgi:dihydroorotate dehydrogenase
MIASGFAGYGPAYQRLLDLSAFGAIVTNPITLRPRPGPAQPRLVETPGGFILNTGEQNPGVKKVIQQAQKSWAALPTAIIAHLPADDPDDLLRTAREVFEVIGRGVVRIEIGQTYAMRDVQQAHRDLQSRRTIGSTVLLP